jgi:S-adenosylhomocysteine hydrolase
LSETSENAGHFQARLEVSHVGTGNDEKARVKWSVNTISSLVEGIVMKPSTAGAATNANVGVGLESDVLDSQFSVANAATYTTNPLATIHNKASAAIPQVLSITSATSVSDFMVKLKSSGPVGLNDGGTL